MQEERKYCYSHRAIALEFEENRLNALNERVLDTFPTPK